MSYFTILLFVAAAFASVAFAFAAEAGQSDEAASAAAPPPDEHSPAEQRRALLQQHVAEAVRLFETQDSVAAVTYLVALEDDAMACDAMGKLPFTMYYEKKNLAAAVCFGQAAVQHALTAAVRKDANDQPKAQMFRRHAKSTCYNLGSFTWPGWNEPGIQIDASLLSVGMDAAKANLRLAYELDVGPGGLSRAHWLLGAQHLAAGALDDARASFNAAAEHAGNSDEADAGANVLMNQGYAQLVDVLANSNDAAAEERLQRTLKQLAGVKDGQFLREQIETARAVFRAGS